MADWNTDTAKNDLTEVFFLNPTSIKTRIYKIANQLPANLYLKPLPNNKPEVSLHGKVSVSRLQHSTASPVLWGR